jgi:hypothetical protein
LLDNEIYETVVFILYSRIGFDTIILYYPPIGGVNHDFGK